MILVLTTLPSLSVGRKLANLLLKEKLAACVSLTQAIESHYVWKKKKRTCREYFCWIKTRKTLGGKVEKFLAQNHPYKIPEILFLPITRASDSYLKWAYDVTA